MDDSEVHAHQMTDEEKAEYQRRKEEERRKYPRRFRGGKSIMECASYEHEKKVNFDVKLKKRRRYR